MFLPWDDYHGMKAMNRLVSIILPTYNGGGFIKKTLRSILKQTYSCFECIVINDNSTDNTENVIKSFCDRRIHYIKHSSQKGVSRTRNAGLSQAQGVYIAYCDQDDIYYPDHLRELVCVLECKPNVGLAYSGFIEKGISAQRSFFPTFNKLALESKNIIGPPLAVLHRRECIKHCGGFDESRVIERNGNEDHDLWLRISDYYDCYRLNEVLGETSFHGGNRSYAVDFNVSYRYIVGKRWRKRNTRKRKIYYIDHCAIDVVCSLLLSKNNVYYAAKLVSEFYRRKRNTQTIVCMALINSVFGKYQNAIGGLLSAEEILLSSRQGGGAMTKKDINFIRFCLIKFYIMIQKMEAAEKVFMNILISQVNLKDRADAAFPPRRQGVQLKEIVKCVLTIKNCNFYYLRNVAEFLSLNKGGLSQLFLK